MFPIRASPTPNDHFEPFVTNVLCLEHYNAFNVVTVYFVIRVSRIIIFIMASFMAQCFLDDFQSQISHNCFIPGTTSKIFSVSSATEN